MAFYGGGDVTVPTPRRGLWRWDKHVVNTAMALKAYALSWRITRRDAERAFPVRMFEVLDRYHGQVTGMFTGDECLAGKNPVQGTELCAVVEALYSLEHLLSVTGNPAFGDRLERIAFNALPATFAPTCGPTSTTSRSTRSSVRSTRTICGPPTARSRTSTASSQLRVLHGQHAPGWPSWPPPLDADSRGRSGGHGLCTVFGPYRRQGHTRQRGGRHGLSLPRHDPADGDGRQAVRFPLSCGSGMGRGRRPPRRRRAGEAGQARLVPHLERQWQGSVEISLRLPMKVKTSQRYNGAVAVERGPLIYSLRLGETWTRVNADKPHRELPHGDFEVRPTSPWNYGVLIDEERPETSVTCEEQPVGERPFSPEGAGVVCRIKGRRLPGWKLQNGWAAEVQPGPQDSAEPIEDLALIPYGCTNIRVTEFPRIKK